MSLSIHNTASRAAAPRRPFSPLRALRGMFALAHQRHTLAALPDHLLEDIGISAEDAAKEAGRAPWDVPAHWRG